MRTDGTFQEVFAAAAEFAKGGYLPADPVVRREGGRWMLESAAEPNCADFEVSLADFDEYFWEAYQHGWEPTDADAVEFVEAFGE